MTVNNYDSALLEKVRTMVNININNRAKVTFVAFQREVAPNTGTPHLQVYVQLNAKKLPRDFSSFIERYLGRRCHTEGCRGSAEDNVDYVSKEASRAPGTEPEVFGTYEPLAASPQGPGAGFRTDLAALRAAIDDGKSRDELVDEHFEMFVRYDKFLSSYILQSRQRKILQELRSMTSGTTLRPWQEDLLSLVTAPPVPRRISWWWESIGNVGKSFMARHLELHHGAITLQLMKKADMIHLLSKQILDRQCVIFDLTRSSEDGSVKVVYEVAEMVSDGYLCSGKYDSTSLRFKPPHVIIFSNYEPDRSTLSADRWDVHHIATAL
jgi:hypothetical protein